MSVTYNNLLFKLHKARSHTDLLSMYSRQELPRSGNQSQFLPLRNLEV